MRVWGGSGIGMGGSFKDHGGMTWLNQLVVQKEPHYYAARLVMMVPVFDDGAYEAIGDLGILFGRTYIGRAGHVAFAAGAAVVSDETAGGVGIPYALDAAFSYRVIGLGAQLYGNVNTRATFIGAVIYLQLGWLPPEKRK